MTRHSRLTLKQAFVLSLEALSKPCISAAGSSCQRAFAETPSDKQIDNYIGLRSHLFSRVMNTGPGETWSSMSRTPNMSRAKSRRPGTRGRQGSQGRPHGMGHSDGCADADQRYHQRRSRSYRVVCQADQYTALKGQSEDRFCESGAQRLLRASSQSYRAARFNNPKIAQAALMAVNQEALMRAQMVHKELYIRIHRFNPTGFDIQLRQNLLLHGKAANRKSQGAVKGGLATGTNRWFSCTPANFAVLNKFTPVMGALLSSRLASMSICSRWTGLPLVSRPCDEEPSYPRRLERFSSLAGIFRTISNPLF